MLSPNLRKKMAIAWETRKTETTVGNARDWESKIETSFATCWAGRKRGEKDKESQEDNGQTTRLTSVS